MHLQYLITGLLLSTLSWSQTATPPGVYRVGGGVSAPKLISRVEPEYSAEGRRAIVNGTVLLDLVVSEAGIPESLRIKRGMGFGLDEMAVSAVQTWRFNPGMKEGMPVKIMATIEVSFRLLIDSHANQKASLIFGLPEGQTRPILTQGRIPQNIPNNGQDKMRIKLSIGNNGKVTAINVLETTNKEWSNLAQLDIADWRFETSAEATATLELSNTAPGSAPKSAGPVKLVPITNLNVEDSALRAPQLLLPHDKEEFNISPRRTSFFWHPSAGAASYLLEWDYGNSDVWETDAAKRAGVAYSVAGTQFHFDFVGAQMGRWRVWPVNTKGEKGILANGGLSAT